MRIAFIYPYLTRISGSRGPLAIASALSSGNEVDIFTYSVRENLIDSVKFISGKASFYYLHNVEKSRFGILFAIKYQVLRGIDRELFRMIHEKHRENPYDMVIVASNEGRNIGQYMKKIDERKPVTSLILMELHDHGFHMYYERKYGMIRLLAWPIYPMINIIERWRFRSFDLIFANSLWTSTMFQYLYGIEVAASLPTLAPENLSESPSDSGYIAVPTVSITAEQIKIIQKLANDGFKLKCFGPRKVDVGEYFGFVTDQERLKLMAGARATLFLFDYEALGLIPLESLQLGTPVVTIPKEGPLSELRDCSDVYFATEYDQFQEILSELVSRPKATETVERCKSYASRFAPENSVKKILQAYTYHHVQRFSGTSGQSK